MTRPGRSGRERKEIGVADLPLPAGLLPMEAKLVDRLPEGGGWQFEPKWDGFRCLAFKAGSEVELRSKSGRSLARFFPEIVALAQALMWGGQQVHTVHQVPVRYALCPDHLHGRVNATIRTTVWGSSTVGALLGGVLGDAVGLPATLAATGVGAALAAGWIIASPAGHLRRSTDLSPSIHFPP